MQKPAYHVSQAESEVQVEVPMKIVEPQPPALFRDIGANAQDLSSLEDSEETSEMRANKASDFAQPHSAVPQFRRHRQTRFDTKIVGVCGMSCSGKSTVTKTLTGGSDTIPIICLDKFFFLWMDDDPSRTQRTNFLPPSNPDRAWKNWESEACVDWHSALEHLHAVLEKYRGQTPYVIVEGFLLAEHKPLSDMCDAIVSIEIGREVAWQRRLKRAMDMAAGELDASGEENYEVLGTYAMTEDFDTVRSDAAHAVEVEGRASVFPNPEQALVRSSRDLQEASGDYDWLWLYFQELIWPSAERVRTRLGELQHAGLRVHSVDGTQPEEQVAQQTASIIRSLTQKQ